MCKSEKDKKEKWAHVARISLIIGISCLLLGLFNRHNFFMLLKESCDYLQPALKRLKSNLVSFLQNNGLIVFGIILVDLATVAYFYSKNRLKELFARSIKFFKFLFYPLSEIYYVFFFLLTIFSYVMLFLKPHLPALHITWDQYKMFASMSENQLKILANLDPIQVRQIDVLIKDPTDIITSGLAQYKSESFIQIDSLSVDQLKVVNQLAHTNLQELAQVPLITTYKVNLLGSWVNLAYSLIVTNIAIQIVSLTVIIARLNITMADTFENLKIKSTSIFFKKLYRLIDTGLRSGKTIKEIVPVRYFILINLSSLVILFLSLSLSITVGKDATSLPFKDIQYFTNIYGYVIIIIWILSYYYVKRVLLQLPGKQKFWSIFVTVISFIVTIIELISQTISHLPGVSK